MIRPSKERPPDTRVCSRAVTLSVSLCMIAVPVGDDV